MDDLTPGPGYWAALLALLTSSSTLVCCALPALLVALGAGAALSGLISLVPQLVIFSEYKTTVFGFALLMLLASGFWQWRNRSAACPVGMDPSLAASCERTRKLSLRIYLLSVVLFVLGAWFAFVQPLLLQANASETLNNASILIKPYASA